MEKELTKETVTRRAGRGRWLGTAMTLALLVALLAARATLAEDNGPAGADVISQRWLNAETLCAADGGTFTWTVTADDNGNVTSEIVSCSGGDNGDWQCEIATKTPSCSVGFTRPPVRPGAGSLVGQEGQVMNASGPVVQTPPAIGIVNTGNHQVIEGSDPTPTPTNRVSGISSITAVTPAPALSGGNPTPTPTPPTTVLGVIGGITVKPGPAQLPLGPTPPPSGSRSGIFVNAWQCPSGVGSDEGQLMSACKVVYTINFEVYGPNLHQFPNGGIAMQALPAGDYRVREYVPNGYSVADAFCGVAPSEDQQPVQSPVVVYDGYYEFTLGQDQSVYCNWFNVPLQGSTPTRVAGGVLVPGGVTTSQNAQAPSGASPVAPTVGTPVP